MAQVAYESLDFDEVWLLPAAAPPHKTDRPVHSYHVRHRMTEALIAGYPGLSVCAIEAERKDLSYTSETVRILQERYPATVFEWLMGSDSLSDLPDWHEAEDLCERIRFVVAARSDCPYEAALETVKEQVPSVQTRLLPMPMLDVSSTYLRSRVAKGLPVCGLVPEPVLAVWHAEEVAE